jgi:predicted O-methyltransferase YrrM
MPEAPTIPPATLERLIQEGADAWEEFRSVAQDRHHLFIPCDHQGAYEALRALRTRATTFLECGSGAGVVTIMADLLGFEAYGIEIEPWLVDRSSRLAEELGSGAVFAEGSFVPVDYQDEIEHLSGDFLTPTDGACAFEELDLELSDFDLVFAYPWPGDEEWLATMVRRHARPDALLLTYDVSDGFRVTEGGVTSSD